MSSPHEEYGNTLIRKGGLAMKVFADRLINVLENHRREIAQQWCNAVRQNPRTASFSNFSEDELLKRAGFFYKNLITMYFSEKRYTEVRKYFSEYALIKYRVRVEIEYFIAFIFL